MVTKKPKGLGRGLEALLGPKVDETAGAVGEIAGSTAGMPMSMMLDDMVPGMYQPRTRMDEGALYELAESIKAQGIMQPILVRPIEGGYFEIIAGERRWRAAQLAGMKQVPAVVRDVPDGTALAMALIENIQRENLNPLEEAAGLQRLIEEFGMTHEAAAEAVGRSRSAVSNLLRLLALAKPVQELLMSGALEMGHARALLSFSAQRQVELAEEGFQGRRGPGPGIDPHAQHSNEGLTPAHGLLFHQDLQESAGRGHVEYRRLHWHQHLLGVLQGVRQAFPVQAGGRIDH